MRKVTLILSLETIIVKSPYLCLVIHSYSDKLDLGRTPFHDINLTYMLCTTLPFDYTFILANTNP